ncbi:hypothetical protein [Streptomyces sp. NPDC059122]|uniref:hypothetical protein n=1 Tax=Streptomyces sp. NPDC059122 TaxID=3346732 RepID=UPI003687FC75
MALRDPLDPTGLFANPYLDQVLDLVLVLVLVLVLEATPIVGYPGASHPRRSN